MKKLTFVSFLTLLCFCLPALGQTDKEKARDKTIEAIELMDGGKIDESLKLLEEAAKLDPDDPSIKYEIAFAHYLNKNYKDAVKVMKKLVDHEKATDRYYQLLGNSYDMDGQRKKAIETYEAGLKRFPGAGSLYLELGVVQLDEEEYNKALDYFEQGIKAAPTHSSNYYWAAKIYCNSTEEVWGMLYGEIFMNMERNTRRTAEMSKLLYDTYKKGIIFNDTSITISFSQSNTISISDPKDLSQFKLPFPMAVYEMIMGIAVGVGEKEITMASLNKIRSTFLDLYFNGKNEKEYPNALFDYQKTVKDAGHLEAYNYWILMKGDEDAYNKWANKNKEKNDAFMKWFNENKMVINADHSFHSSQY